MEFFVTAENAFIALVVLIVCVNITWLGYCFLKNFG